MPPVTLGDFTAKKHNIGKGYAPSVECLKIDKASTGECAVDSDDALIQYVSHMCISSLL